MTGIGIHPENRHHWVVAKNRRGEKEPLYRKVNTRARGVHHGFGGDYRHERHLASTDDDDQQSEIGKSMYGTKRRGLDYTPLYRFLLSKVGEDWDAVYSEALARLDQEKPIFWMVRLDRRKQVAVVSLGESTYYNGLYVDDKNRLQRVKADLDEHSFRPVCACCTHTFNGVPFTKAWAPHDDSEEYRYLGEMTGGMIGARKSETI